MVETVEHVRNFDYFPRCDFSAAAETTGLWRRFLPTCTHCNLAPTHLFAAFSLVFANLAPPLSPFQFEVLTTGWVSLALTFRGDLRGADIIVGWVDDGKATIVVSGA